MASYTSHMAFAIFSAVAAPLLNAKIDGPEPDIPEPKAPFSKAACLIESNPGMRTLRKGSTISSCKERPIKS